MATGDIHNHNGSICKASKVPCPLGAEGHSKDIDSYVEHHVQESGVDGDAVRTMISDGTPPADAVEVAKNGLSATGSPLSREYEAYEDAINEETYGHLRDLQGEEKLAAIADAEQNLAAEFRDGLYETEAEGDSIEELESVYRNRLAAIHGIEKDRVIVNGDGDIEVDRTDGKVSIYNSNFELKETVDGYETDENEADVLREVYGPIQDLKGEERNRAIQSAEGLLASEYQEGKYEIGADSTDVQRARDTRHLNRAYRNSVAAIHGVAPDRVSTDSQSNIQVRTADGVSIYNSEFERKE